MGTRTNTTRDGTPASPGVVRPSQFVRTSTFGEAEPADDAAYWVQSVWSVRWSLPPGEQVVNSLVPNPSTNLTVERGDGRRRGRHGDGVWLTGVVTRRFDVVTEGVGGVVGLKFRPGGFAALTGCDAAGLTDRVVSAASLVPSVEELAVVALDVEESGAAMCAWVAGLRRAPDERFEAVTGVVRALQDPAVTRVAHLSDRCGMSVRSLQRLLRAYVGVGPKWLLARQRMHDAMAALDDGYAGPIADLAAALGWADQTHFTRDFVALVGTPPAAYRERLRSDGMRPRGGEVVASWDP